MILGVMGIFDWLRGSKVPARDSDNTRRSKDAQVIRVLAGHGDMASRPHQIDHFAYFRSESDAQQFAAWAAASGFLIKTVSQSSVKMLPVCVEFTHTGPATLEAVFTKTTAAEEAAARCSGLYDGWGTGIVAE